jgi:DNA polymerase III delta subunit
VSWQWTNPPPVVVLSGAVEFLRIRELKKAISAADKKGREVQYIAGPDRDSLSGVLSSSGMFFKGTNLVVIEDPEKVDPELVKDHHDRGDNTTSIVLHHVGGIKAKSPLGKLVKSLPPKVVADFVASKPWEADEQAIQFLAREAKSKKLKLDLRLAAGMVQNIGTDYGILSFEIDKIARLISARGDQPEIKADHVKAVIAGFSELGAMPVVNALGRKDLRGVSRALSNMKRTHAGHASGATLKACALLGHNVATWLHVASLLAQGANTDEISERIKLHPFVVRKNILPVARGWSEGSLVSLLNSIALVERSVKAGHANPWVQLECAIFRSLEERTHG